MKDKQVGLVGNKSSLVGDLHLLDALLSKGINVTKVFCPEHGFRGEGEAGELIDDHFDKKTGNPYRFIRKIDEGGYTKDKEIHFHQNSNKATVKDHEKKTEEMFSTHKDVHDMLSTLYFLRSQDISKMKPGDEVKLTMFFDEKNYPFKLRFLGTETIKTKFGKVASAKFRPLVQAGRVFKAKESITVWVSNDQNKIPLRIKADLAVGSLRADLDLYKGLANSFPMIFD